MAQFEKREQISKGTVACCNISNINTNRGLACDTLRVRTVKAAIHYHPSIVTISRLVVYLSVPIRINWVILYLCLKSRKTAFYTTIIVIQYLRRAPIDSSCRRS